MNTLPCDICGSTDTNAYGSWSTPLTIKCGKCQDKLKEPDKGGFVHTKNTEIKKDRYVTRLDERRIDFLEPDADDYDL